MLRILGSALVLAGGLLARQIQFSEHRRREKTLMGLLSAFRQMAEEIRLVRTPMPLLLERLAESCQGEGQRFLSLTASSVRQGESLPSAWHQAAKILTLPDSAQRALVELGDNFHGDSASICKAISLSCNVFARELGELQRCRPDAEKRATALWLSGAALLVIVLL